MASLRKNASKEGNKMAEQIRAEEGAIEKGATAVDNARSGIENRIKDIEAKMAELGGARCCKRNAFLSLSTGARFVRERYGVPMESGEIVCDHYPRNAQCLGKKCPYHPTAANE